MSTFTISAPAGTDIWRKPPSTDVFTGPYKSVPGSSSTGQLEKFKSARVSFAFPLTPAVGAEKYDQGGLLITFPGTKRWVKTGIEVYHGKPMLSTVATDTASDWSIVEHPESATADSKTWTGISVEAGEDELGRSLLVFAETAGGEKRIQLREICWVYAFPDTMTEIAVAAFAARPAKTTKDVLEVEFKDFEVVFA